MEQKEVIEFSNPRRSATIAGWPWGKHRTTARFFVEANKRGERVGRILKDREGRDCAAKFTTYSRKARIVDGSDGRTYILELGLYGDTIHVQCGDMKYGAGTVPEDSPRHAAVMALFADQPPAEPAAGGGDITLAEGLDFLRGEGVKVVILDNPDTVAEQLSAAFGAPAAEGNPISGTSHEGRPA